jgi:4-aminobutyrate aminotransferase
MPSKQLDTLFFVNSGAEAVENAIKVARYATGKPNIIVVQGGYHGRSVGTMSLTTSDTVYRSRFGPLMPGVFVTPFPYHLHMPWCKTPEEASDHCIDELRLLLKQQTAPVETAGVILEPVLGEGGYVPPPLDFLKKLKAVCQEHQMLLIADEVQTGFGRTGKYFAVEHFDVEPDILVMAKGIASGMPLSAISANSSVLNKLPLGTIVR